MKRKYYLDINKVTEEFSDLDEAIISTPEDGIVKGKGNVILADYSDMEKECKAGMIPISYLFRSEKLLEWQNKYFSVNLSPERGIRWSKFMSGAFASFNNYQLPVITLLNTTPKDAVCQVFEHVNTGGVTLTVFELLTASFAAENFSLRKDWERRYAGSSVDIDSGFKNNSVLEKLANTDFLQTIALLKTYNRKKKNPGAAVSCKRNDILNLNVADYLEWADKVEKGFYEAAKFLIEQNIFTRRDIPYHTQLIPLSAIFVELGNRANNKTVRDRLARWYWSGVFGELYGSATETRFAKDLPQVLEWIDGDGMPDTMEEANFEIDRLLSMRTRNSAAYKGVHALLMKAGCHDFISGVPIDLQTYMKDRIDIHHIFPVRHCNRNGIDPRIYNSIVNKTPLSATTNRSIGGDSPSIYLEKIETDRNISRKELDKILETHLIDIDSMRTDNFLDFFEKRKIALYNIIIEAMGQEVDH